MKWTDQLDELWQAMGKGKDNLNAANDGQELDKFFKGFNDTEKHREGHRSNVKGQE